MAGHSSIECCKRYGVDTLEAAAKRLQHSPCSMESTSQAISKSVSTERAFTSRLIVNADDFGLTPGVNRGIADLYRAGALSSTTLMANGAAFEDAVSLLKRLPGIGVGCHVVLVDGAPLSLPTQIQTLLGPDRRRLRPSLAAFARAALLGQLDEAEIEREASAQVTRLLEAGIRPTHLDTHKHTHLFPAVLRPLLRVAERFEIPAIRNPFEQPWSLHLGRGRFGRRLQIQLLSLLQRSFHKQPQIQDGRVRTTQGAIGVSATGDLDQATLTLLLKNLPSGTWEFVCHPGFSDEELELTSTRLVRERDVEREALSTVVPEALAFHAIKMVTFDALAEDNRVAGQSQTPATT